MYLNPQQTPEDCILAGELSDKLHTAMLKLRPREECILRRRFGFYSEDTLEDLSKSFMVSKERIRQIEGKALRRLRHILKGYYRPVTKNSDYTTCRLKETPKKLPPSTHIESPPNIIASFPHATLSLSVQVENEWIKFGIEDAKKRGMTPLLWVWLRSRALAGYNSSIDESLRLFNLWKLDHRESLNGIAELNHNPMSWLGLVCAPS